MILAASLLVAGLLPAGTESLRIAPDEGRFVLIADFGPRASVANASTIAETAGGLAARLLRDDPEALRDHVFDVHLYATIEGYEAAEEKRTKGTFKRNLSFAHWSSRSAHVALQPTIDDALRTEIGLPFQTMRLVAHEATHLVVYESMEENFKRHPTWFAEGIATVVEEQTMLAMGIVDDVRADPYMSTMMARAKRLLEDGKLPKVETITGEGVKGLDVGETYAVHWLLFRFLLEEDGKRTRRFLDKAHDLEGDEDFAEELARKLHKIFGLSKLERKWVAYVKSLEPEWTEVFRSLETDGDGWTLLAFPTGNAICWQTRPVGKKRSFTIAGEIRVFDFGRRQMNVLLDKTDDGFVSIALVAGQGVTVFQYHGADDRWERKTHFGTDRLEPGRKTPFSVSWTGSELDISLDGESLGTVGLGCSMRGPWGLGAQAGSGGEWYDVELR